MPRVFESMRRNVYCVSPDMSLVELVRELVERKRTMAPVVDTEGQLLGVVSLVDVAVHGVFAGEGNPLGNRPVSSIMTMQVVQVAPDADLKLAVELLRERPVHRLVVTDGRLVVGTLGARDLLDRVLESTRPRLNLPE